MCYSIEADTLKVAVVDTGLKLDDPRLSAHICLTGNKDFTGTGIQDNYGHGTHIVGLIEQYAKDADYCLSMIKYTDDAIGNNGDYIKAIEEAVSQHPDMINLSVSGENFNDEERETICGHPEITFIVAAGNESKDLDINPMYPAALGCKNIIVVGSTDFTGSNYGTMVHVLEQGLNVESTMPNGKTGSYTGTSQSCAIHTGKLINEKSHQSH